CQSVQPISDSQCCLTVPASAAYQWQSVPPISAMAVSAAYQCQSVLPISAAYQCCQSVLPYISAMYQCCLSVPISDAFQCPSVPPISVHQC
ncbi:unnamed protein product, partial [Staurois parvus]